jgi:hypothetical protein
MLLTRRYLKFFSYPVLLSFILIVSFLFFTPDIYADSPELITYYDFNGNLSDSINGSSLTAFGEDNDGYDHNNATSGFGNDSGYGGDTSYWYWTSDLARGGGFYIDIDNLDETNYSLGIRFSFNETSPGWKKIIDYKNMTSDHGFYFYNKKLQFYPNSTGNTEIENNAIVDIIATRDGDTGLFKAYFVIDGVIQEPPELNSDVGDSSIPVVVNGKARLGFFFDDTATPAESASGGKIYSLKIWNGPISYEDMGTAMDPEPASADCKDNGNAGADEEAPAIIRTNPMTCWQVRVNEDNNFEFIFWWEYGSNNWVKIYDMNENPVYVKDFKKGQPHFEVPLPDGFYTVRTFHD